jgi:hypothetical protein
VKMKARTDGVYLMMLEQRADHGVTDHYGRYLKGLELERSQAA